MSNIEEAFVWASNIDDLRDMGRAGEVLGRTAEAFVTPSTNIHATFLNEIRTRHFDAFLDIIAEGYGVESVRQIEERTGREATKQEKQRFSEDFQALIDLGQVDANQLKTIANILNLMTGRSLVKGASYRSAQSIRDEIGNFARSILFSPQYTLSRFEIPIVAASVAYNSAKRSVIPRIAKGIKESSVSDGFKSKMLGSARFFDRTFSAGRYSVKDVDDVTLKELNRRFTRLYKIGGSILATNVMSALAYALLSGEDMDEAVDLAKERIQDYVDPQSPQFGQLRIDNPAQPGETIKADIFGGVPSTVRRVIPFSLEEGEMLPFQKDGSFFNNKTIFGNLGRLLNNKKHPFISAAVVTFDGYDFMGNPVTPPEWLAQIVEIGLGPELAPDVARNMTKAVRGTAEFFTPITVRAAITEAINVASGEKDPLSADFYADTFIPPAVQHGRIHHLSIRGHQGFTIERRKSTN